MEQTKADLKEHLADQIHFLESSAESYDNGFDGEAKRLANSIRLLLHDTGKSKSLIGQVGLKDTEFYDTAFEYNPNDPLYDAGLVVKSCDLETGEWKFSPLLDTAPQTRKTKFEIWWNTPVFIDTLGNKLSRKDLILSIADQDSGAHVDPSIDGTYVQPYQRTNPDRNPYNNYNFPGNYNPNTYEITPGNPDTYLRNYDNHRNQRHFKPNNYFQGN